jgi:hypothetical protein
MKRYDKSNYYILTLWGTYHWVPWVFSHDLDSVHLTDQSVIMWLVRWHVICLMNQLIVMTSWYWTYSINCYHVTYQIAYRVLWVLQLGDIFVYLLTYQKIWQIKLLYTYPVGNLSFSALSLLTWPWFCSFNWSLSALSLLSNHFFRDFNSKRSNFLSISSLNTLHRLIVMTSWYWTYSINCYHVTYQIAYRVLWVLQLGDIFV